MATVGVAAWCDEWLQLSRLDLLELDQVKRVLLVLLNDAQCVYIALHLAISALHTISLGWHGHMAAVR